MRRKLAMPEAAQELNLAPFMNLVVLLIPLLLLSVVFEQVAVLPAQAPSFSTIPAPPGGPPFSLHVTLSVDGFRVDAADHVQVKADGSCPQGSALTLCNADAGQVAALLEQVRQQRRRFDQTGDRAALALSDQRMREARQGYNFQALTHTLEAIKRAHPDEQRATLAADPDIPYELVVATMEAMRGQPERGEPLFQDVVLGVVQ